MKLAAVLLTFACAAMAFAGPGQNDTEAATKSKIVALEQLWNQAYKAGDMKALDSLLDNSIVLVNDDGSVQTKTEFLASVKESLAQPSSQQQQVEPEAFVVHVYGTTAIATGVMKVKGVEAGKAYTRRERFVDTWVNKGGNWVCVGTDATPVVH
jgi:ketosteroid isomerase-like protein